MFKIYSKGCEYVLRALTQIPVEQSHLVFSPKLLCKRGKLPESYTRKIFQSLVKQGLLKAAPGPGGGYMLTRPATNITLLDIILAIDGEDAFARCIMGLPACDKSHPCPVHSQWKQMKEMMVSEMGNSTLADLMQTVKKRGRPYKTPARKATLLKEYAQ